MQLKEVQELIEVAVKPLRERIAYLQKENEKLKAQISTHAPPPPRHQYLRQRSSSKQDKGLKKVEGKQLQSPAKKKEEEKQKPVWGYVRPNNKAQPHVKSPNAKDKIPHIPTSPRGQHRPSKQKPEAQKKIGNPVGVPEKKITGGKRVDIEHQSPQTQLKKEEQPHPVQKQEEHQP